MDRCFIVIFVFTIDTIFSGVFKLCMLSVQTSIVLCLLTKYFLAWMSPTALSCIILILYVIIKGPLTVH